VRSQLASVLNGVVSQRLIKKIGGGRIPALEILKNNAAVANIIRQNQIHQIGSVMETSQEEGMIVLEKYLADLISSGTIETKEAERYVRDVDNLYTYLGH
jgi:twitching motility protein PilT